MRIVTGDLLTLANSGEFDVIIHGCNCFNTMGSGIARAIASNYPAALLADLATVKGDRAKLGTYTQTTVTNPVKSFTIINAYTQYRYNGRIDLFEYLAFQQILDTLAKEFTNSNFGFPLIGCGLAGGDKNRIVSMINSFSKLIDGNVTIVEFG